MNYLYGSKFITISAENGHIKTLNLVFYKEGFSFGTSDEKGRISKISHIKVTHPNRWESEIIKELETDLRLRRNFDKVFVAFVSSFFNLVPKEYMVENYESLLNFSEAEFEDNQILKSFSSTESCFVYGTSSVLVRKLKELFGQPVFTHSGQIFLDSLEKTNEPVVHLNLLHHQLEIAVTAKNDILFYNLFETPTGEDILFFTLFTLEQLGLDTNKAEIKCYGELLPSTKVFQILKKYVRYLKAAMKDEEFLANFTLQNLSKCASSQALLEGKK